MLGEPALAVHWLKTAVDKGFVNYPFLARHDPAPEPSKMSRLQEFGVQRSNLT